MRTGSSGLKVTSSSGELMSAVMTKELTPWSSRRDSLRDKGLTNNKKMRKWVDNKNMADALKQSTKFSARKGVDSKWIDNELTVTTWENALNYFRKKSNDKWQSSKTNKCTYMKDKWLWRRKENDTRPMTKDHDQWVTGSDKRRGKS